MAKHGRTFVEIDGDFYCILCYYEDFDFDPEDPTLDEDWDA